MAAISIEKENITYRTLSGLFWMFTGTGAHAVLEALVLIILARLLTPSDFGLVGAALVVVGFSLIFSQLGIGPAIVQRPKLEQRHLCTGFMISMLFGAVLTGIILFAAPVISGFFRMDGLTPVMRVMSFVFLLQGLSVVAESLLQRDLRFNWLAGVRIVSFAIGYGVVGVSLAFMKFGVWALAWAHLGQAILRAAMLLIVQPHPKLLRFDWRSFRELIYFGGGFTAARIGNYIAGQGDNLVVARWLGAEALGLYGRAYQLMAMPATLFGQALDKVLFPVMASVQNQPELLAKAYRRGVSLVALLVLPTSVASLVLAPELIHVVLGPQWVEVIVPFQIFAIGMLFRTSYKMGDSLARATGAVYRRAWRQGLYATFVLGAAYVGKHWGISGVVIGVLCALATNFILMAHLSLSLTPITWRTFSKAHLPAFALAAIVFSEVWLAAMVMRYLAVSPIAVLTASVLVVSVTVLILSCLMPKVFLGQDGIWMFQTVSGYISEKLEPLHRFQRGN